jgi:hypothetical protein
MITPQNQPSDKKDNQNNENDNHTFIKELSIVIIVYSVIFLTLTLTVSHIDVLSNNSFLRGLLAISMLSFSYNNIQAFNSFFIHKTLLALLILIIIFHYFNITEKKVSHIF